MNRRILLTRKQAWRRQDCTYQDGGRFCYTGSPKPSDEDKEVTETIDNAIKNSNKNNTVGLYTALFPLQYGALFKYICDFIIGSSAEKIIVQPALSKRKVGFNCAVKVVLIPSRLEFIQAGIAQDVWYNDEIDYSGMHAMTRSPFPLPNDVPSSCSPATAFKRTACRELRGIMSEKNIFCHKEAMRILYQPTAADLDYPTPLPQASVAKKSGLAPSIHVPASDVVTSTDEATGVEVEQERPVDGDSLTSESGTSNPPATGNVGYDLDEAQCAGIPATSSRCCRREAAPRPLPPLSMPPPPPSLSLPIDEAPTAVTTATPTTVRSSFHVVRPPECEPSSPVSVTKHLSPQPTCRKTLYKVGAAGSAGTASGNSSPRREVGTTMPRPTTPRL